MKRRSDPTIEAFKKELLLNKGPISLSQYLSRFGLKTPQDVIQFLRSPLGKAVLAECRDELMQKESLKEAEILSLEEQETRRHRYMMFLLFLLLMHKAVARDTEDLLQWIEEQNSSHPGESSELMSMFYVSYNALQEQHQQLSQDIENLEKYLAILEGKKIALDADFKPIDNMDEACYVIDPVHERLYRKDESSPYALLSKDQDVTLLTDEAWLAAQKRCAESKLLIPKTTETIQREQHAHAKQREVYQEKLTALTQKRALIQENLQQLQKLFMSAQPPQLSPLPNMTLSPLEMSPKPTTNAPNHQTQQDVFLKELVQMIPENRPLTKHMINNMALRVNASNLSGEQKNRVLGLMNTLHPGQYTPTEKQKWLELLMQPNSRAQTPLRKAPKLN